MPRVLPVLILALLVVYCVVEVAQTRTGQVRAMPRWLWAFLVICAPVVGPLSWLFFGRPSAGTPSPRVAKAPDDDEDFLRGLR